MKSVHLLLLIATACAPSKTETDAGTDTDVTPVDTTDGVDTVADTVDTDDTVEPVDSADTDGPALVPACGDTMPIGHTEASHEKHEANYDILMGDGDVPRLDILICPDDFATMTADLASLRASQGGGGPGGGGATFPDETPVYVPANVVYDGQSWPQVGIRYKGNSSLYSGRSNKLPFRLAMDRYEDEYTNLDNQRFYGFKDLKFSSAFNDDSFQRDKLASDTFRAAGVPAARGGFVRVYIDVGNGPEYWGLYSVFEDAAGELLDSWFGDDDGNAYKPDGDDATLSGGVDPDVFEKKTNEDEADYSDIEAFVGALNASRADAAAWRSNLEATFDMDGFIRYLAVNNLIGNWDSYGRMTHNYYLYGDPTDNNRLTWIPWDFNESYMSGRGSRAAINPDMTNLPSGWPLLTWVDGDPVYRAQYEAELEDLLDTVFTLQAQTDRITANQARIESWAAAESSAYTNAGGSFSGATSDLIDHVTSQRSAGQAALR